MNAVVKTTHFTQAPGSPDIRVERLEANLGAEIFGLNLAAPLSPEIAELLPEPAMA